MAPLDTANFATIGATDLYSAIQDFISASLPSDDRRSEGFTVDFKSEWSDNSLRVVAAFANTFGGILIVGVTEKLGRAVEAVGCISNGELKTRIASSIAASITPTPIFEVAECANPLDLSKRLAVIRVRSDRRIHFFLKGTNPVYVRNEDEAVPARADQLRSLIEMERSLERARWQPRQQSSDMPKGFQVTRALVQGTPDDRRRHRTESESFARIWVEPLTAARVELDYLQERFFSDLCSSRFNALIEPSFNGMAYSDEDRTSSYYIRSVSHRAVDSESTWCVTSQGSIGFASSLKIVGGKFPVWSVPDVAANIICTLGLSNDFLSSVGYFGEVRVQAFVLPVGARILREGSGFGTYSRKDVFPNGWEVVIPAYEDRPVHEVASAELTVRYDERTENPHEPTSRLLNQILRDLGFASDSTSIRSAVKRARQQS